MPFASVAQQRFAHANPDKFGGKKKLAEWDSATNFETLPEKVSNTSTDDTSTRGKKFNYAPKRAGYAKAQRLA